MPRPALYYTFGNHMHWVDMQWLWGGEVLPGSVADMLALTAGTGARGNVNFDGIGYEKMAAECPESLARLREAVDQGVIEPVGGTYGQPYGLFHGGESNVRQLTYGSRAVRRTLGVFPRSFWEEEFYFFPQLPQMLAHGGYTGACLFFQWTWHTPEIPAERHPLILWQGIDGSSLHALPRGELNVHQWPEDFDGLLDRAARDSLDPADARVERTVCDEPTAHGVPPCVVQWLELMPSRDWMCRSEVLLPRLRELLSDQRFDIRTGTIATIIGELTLAADGRVPTRHYPMDDVWHGMTLGKNGDRHPRRSRRLEDLLLSAESASAVASLFGRPYAQWDVYPAWELEEGWRDLLAAQHHDNHECEGLCGHIAVAAMERVEHMVTHVLDRSTQRLLGASPIEDGRILVFNPTGRSKDLEFHDPVRHQTRVAHDVPPFGFRILDPTDTAPGEPMIASENGDILELRQGLHRVMVDRTSGAVIQVCTPDFPEGLADAGNPVARPLLAGNPARLRPQRVSLEHDPRNNQRRIAAWFIDDRGAPLRMTACPTTRGVDISLEADEFVCQSPGFAGSLMLEIRTRLDSPVVTRDTPYSVEPVTNPRPGRRKYPLGDWMTSPQWFEQVEHAFTSLTWVRLTDPEDGRSIHIRHDGSQQWFLRPTLRAVVTARDPWDESAVHGAFSATFRFEHQASSDPDRPPVVAVRQRPLVEIPTSPHPTPTPLDHPPNFPRVFGPLHIEDAPTVTIQAFFRESATAGDHLPAWAGHRMKQESGGACTHPFVIRLVEWDGVPADVTLLIAGPVAIAAKTNLLGEVLRHGPPAPLPRGASPGDTGILDVQPADPPTWARSSDPAPFPWSRVRFALRPREIATIYADIIPGRKVFRDLDAKREVWATVHRQAGEA